MLFLVIWFLFGSYISFSTEAATRGVLCKKVFLAISHNSQENTCARGIFNKVAGLTSGRLLLSGIQNYFALHLKVH